MKPINYNDLSDNDFDKLTVSTFPNLYADRNASMQITCMCWGFEISSGWKNLIWECSEKIEKEILKLPLERRSNCKASQVKTKFGGLRFYMTQETPKMQKIISKYESKSYMTCEACGKIGIACGRGWVYTLCRKHQIEHNVISPSKFEFILSLLFPISYIVRFYINEFENRYKNLIWKIKYKIREFKRR